MSSPDWSSYTWRHLHVKFWYLYPCNAGWTNLIFSFRYAYSDDGSEDFDREDSLSLIKPGPVSSKDARGSAGLMDARAAVSNDTTTSHNGDIEEDKRE